MPELFPSKTVTNLPKTLNNNSMLSICHSPKAKTSLCKRLLGGGSQRSAARGQGAASRAWGPGLGAETVWAPSMRRWSASCDGAHRVMGCILCLVLQSLLQLCQWCCLGHPGHPHTPPPAKAEARVSGAMSPFIPTARQTGLPSREMSGRPAGSQLCCPAAPSIPSRDVSTPRAEFATRGTLLFHKHATAACCSPRGNLHFPSWEQMDTQSIFPATAETCFSAGI